MKKRFAIIVAGGSGSRMKIELPKQFILLKGIPIIAHTINQFLKADCEVILALPENHLETFKISVLNHCTSKNLTLVKGGETRYQSVKNALEKVEDDSLVAIHDAVRPFISQEIIDLSFTEAAQHFSAVTCVDLKDSIRKLDNGLSKTEDRSLYKLVQTPQTFDTNKLKDAYQKEYQDTFTDDASVFEANGNTIHLIEGDYKNIKITTPEDLLVANAFVL